MSFYYNTLIHFTHFPMTIEKAKSLGQTGKQIKEVLEDILEAVENGDDFIDKAQQLEHVSICCDIISQLMHNLKEK